MRNVGVIRSGRWILDSLDWDVDNGEHWVVLGPNGAGKSTLMSIASARLFPSRGEVAVLGLEMGAVHLSEITPAIGFVGAAEDEVIPATERVIDVVATAVHGMRGRWREEYDVVDIERAEDLLDTWGVGDLADRALGSLSDGEWKRVMIARALMTDPELLILDEPAAGLDVGAREHLVADLEQMALDERGPCTITVTHHFDEIPRTASHAILLSSGRAISQGPIRAVLTDETISTAYGCALRALEHDGRWMVIRA